MNSVAEGLGDVSQLIRGWDIHRQLVSSDNYLDLAATTGAGIEWHHLREKRLDVANSSGIGGV
jgi:hypothetical protein